MALKYHPNSMPSKYETFEIIKNEFLPKKYFSTNEQKAALQIQNKSEQCNIIFTKTDKGNTVVAIDKYLYNQKTLDLINEGNYSIINTIRKL